MLEGHLEVVRAVVLSVRATPTPEQAASQPFEEHIDN